MNAIDTLNARILLAQGPGQNVSPQAPPEVATKVDQLLSLAQYICFGVVILAVMVTGATIAFARQRGDGGEEAAGLALRIGGGVALVAGAVGIVSWMLS